MLVSAAELTVARADERSCALCAQPAGSARPGASADRRDELVVWLGALAGAVLLASVGDGALRWVGVGAVLGIVSAAGAAAYSVRSALRTVEGAHAHEIHALEEDADGRVAAAIRQFEWAVNDVVHLKRQVEKGEAAVDALLDRAHERARYVRQLEESLRAAREELATLATAAGEPGPFSAAQANEEAAPHFRWALHHDGYRDNIELECVASAHRPKRLRIVTEAGDIVMTSGTPMRTEDGVALFSLSKPPAELLGELEDGGTPEHVFEAFVDYEWRPITIEDSGRRTKIVRDKQGRSYRVTDTERMLALRDRGVSVA